jgi:Zn-dependent protease with chaperone function
MIGALGGATSGIAHTLHVGTGVGFGAAMIGACIGAFYGLLFIYGVFFTRPLALIGGMFSGLVVAYITLWLLVHFENQLLRLRGYRDPSRREQELIHPIAMEILRRMGVASSVPRFYVSDSREPAAWSHANSIVVTRGLLGSYDDSENPPVADMPHHALAAVIAHEISHWTRWDGIGIRAVWACCWPIVAVYNLACVLGKRRQTVTLGWLLFWPAWVSVKLIVMPLLTKAMCQTEYEVDAQTAELGDEYRVGLRMALGEFQDWEAPRTGWEDVLHATHPPIEHRLQRLENRLPSVSVSLGVPGRDDLIEYHPPNLLVWLSPLGHPDQNKLFIRDPFVLDLSVQRNQALAEQDNERAALLERDINSATLAWLQRMRDALEHGQAIPIDNSLTEIEQYISGLEQQLDGLT